MRLGGSVSVGLPHKLLFFTNLSSDSILDFSFSEMHLKSARSSKIPMREKQAMKPYEVSFLRKRKAS